ncbi:hypothetical protein QAD02_022562 [Eretmocerus hayati]|uniref:Uncharacterized protein n=1 Tax=Eretmocerus hayati TaxID=131215 RepID=A0ACC2PTG8_9HYME|nr:hypothetical protein QAD02_022562 [Eretmocerus hayati]
MSSSGVPFLLVTANVGSIFEEPNVMLKMWTEEFLSAVARLDPKFIALHCQEVGGKNYEESMKHVEDFVRLLITSEELRLFDKVRVFLDEDFSSAEHFTALGNLYFAHESLKDMLLWDFEESVFVPVSGKEVHSGNIEAITTKEKAKFPQDFFPECKWSRKGFLRTRWSISGTVFDLINIHLFHDASNFIAMETFPSVYSKTRRRALEHTLDRFHNDQYPNAPYFLFGDFNFRTDTAGVIKKLTADTHESTQSNKGSISKLQFRNQSDDLILTLGKKEFSHHEHQQVFIENSGQWLQEYDKELGDFDGRLFEFPIHFVPSYPFQEDVKEGGNYMQTRVPAWCDRVLLSPSAKMLVKDISSPNAIEYGIIGLGTCMGDHKPVYLRVELVPDAGMIDCCSYSGEGSSLCFRVPESFLASEHAAVAAASPRAKLRMPGCRSCALMHMAQSTCTNFLHASPIQHDPYTPDSMDSPSPNTIGSCAPSLDSNMLPNLKRYQYQQPTQQFQQQQQQQIHQDPRAVSPALLKSKLELIARSRQAADENSSENSGENERHRGDPNLMDEDEDAQATRKCRSNSDVSWQRSHLLTRAWLQGKGHQAYHSFSSELHRDFGLDVASNPTELLIPRIAIINASTFQSNASSVHLQQQHELGTCCKHLRQRSADGARYSDTRTRSLSDADSKRSVQDHDNEVEEQKSDDAEKPTFCSEPIKSQIPSIASKNSTRSNSIQSQEANVSLKLRAYNKVTERCRRNIAAKKGRCDKCCVLS